MVAQAGPATRGFNCANCGAAIELRALQHTRAVACTSCAAVVDPRDPTLVILQEDAQRRAPKIPLGTRGKVHDQPFDVVGFQHRQIVVDDVPYGWDEYVLFNPYRGFRYLSEYDGHWNVIRTLRVLPDTSKAGPELQGRGYRHFQTAKATTTFVLGEFPWRVRVGDTVETTDYVAPPLLLSEESTGGETTWSLGEYATGGQIWAMFGLPGAPPPSTGVFANQPSPWAGRVGRTWRTFLVLAALVCAAFLWRLATASEEQVFLERYTYAPGAEGEAAFVTQPFAVKAPGTVEVDISTDVTNSWVYLDVALIDAERGTALNYGKEVEFYTGTDSDGRWTEGSQQGTLFLPQVPEGQYYLRVEPEADKTSPTLHYTIRVRRDVVSLLPYAIVFVLILVPPLWVTVRSASFEGRRWQESDHGSSGGSDDDDDDSGSDD